MSINDPIRFKYNERRERWYVSQGNETFYDDDNVLWEFKTSDEALAWAMENLPSNLIQAEIKQAKLL